MKESTPYPVPTHAAEKTPRSPEREAAHLRVLAQGLAHIDQLQSYRLLVEADRIDASRAVYMVPDPTTE